MGLLTGSEAGAARLLPVMRGVAWSLPVLTTFSVQRAPRTLGERCTPPDPAAARRVTCRQLVGAGALGAAAAVGHQC